MKRIAIIGACCSRDVFNKHFIPNWREYFSVLYYTFQTSMISIMSMPIPYSRELLNFRTGEDMIQEWFRNVFERELNKSMLNDLFSIQPENLLLDFYSDVYNGVLEIENTSYIINRKGSLRDNAMFHLLNVTNEIKVLNDRSSYMKLWKENIKRFFQWCEINIPNTKIIISRPYLVNEVEDKSGQIKEFGENNCDFYNDVYDEMIQYCKCLKPELDIIDLGNKYRIDPDYLHGGAGVVHYKKNYYEDLFEELKKCCVDSDNNTYLSKNYNLIMNNDFRYGTLFWKFWNNRFHVNMKDNKVHINERYNANPIYAQAWCCDVVVREDTDYCLEFDYKVYDDVEFKNEIIMCIRTFLKQNMYSRKEANSQMVVKCDNEYNKVFHKKVIFRPIGEFLSVGIYLNQNGHVEWSNIQLHRVNNGDLEVNDSENAYEWKDYKLCDLNRLKTIY